MEQFGRLCQEYLRPKIYPFALTLLRNRDDAEDVVQEVFARLLTHYQRIRKRALASFEAFVITLHDFYEEPFMDQLAASKKTAGPVVGLNYLSKL